jgi:hypothetical protein
LICWFVLHLFYFVVAPVICFGTNGDIFLTDFYLFWLHSGFFGHIGNAAITPCCLASFHSSACGSVRGKGVKGTDKNLKNLDEEQTHREKDVADNNVTTNSDQKVTSNFNSLKNEEVINFNPKELKDIYKFGLKNSSIVEDNPKFAYVMEVLNDRDHLKERGSGDYGFIEVAEFKNILFLSDGIEEKEELSPLSVRAPETLTAVVKKGEGYQQDAIAPHSALKENGMDTKLDEEFGIYSMENYKKEFSTIISNLKEGRVYKMVFKFTLITLNKDGSENIERATTLSFLVSKNTLVLFVLYKFKHLLHDVLEDYDGPDSIKMSVFIKE